MDKIKSFQKFNEEISSDTLKTIAVGGLASIGAYGMYQQAVKQGTGEMVKEISIDDIKFKKYDIYSNGEVLYAYMSDDGVISTKHSYTKGSGDDKKTVTRYIVNLPPNATGFYYDKKFFDLPTASLKEFNKSQKVELKDLTVTKKTKEYTVYNAGFFSIIDYIVVNHEPKGEEVKIEGQMGIYSCYKVDRDIYAITYKNFGGGKFGGGGAGTSEW